MKNIFLVLLMSLIGAGLTGCWLWEEDEDPASKTVAEWKADTGAVVAQVTEQVNKAKADNPGGDYTKCDEAQAEANAAQSESDSAETQEAAQAANAKAKEALEKAEGCAGEGATEDLGALKQEAVQAADQAIAKAEEELAKIAGSGRSEAQQAVDQSVFNGAKEQATVAKTEADAATTIDQAKAAKSKAEGALERINNHLAVLAGGGYGT